MTRDSFYVGYLPLPPAVRRLVLILIPVLLVGGVAAAVVMSSQQNDPGDGVWDLTDKQVIHGFLEAEPYLHVETPDGGMVFLVGMGKGGVDGVPETLLGEQVKVAGYPIGRGGQTVLMAVETPADIRADDGELLIRLPKLRSYQHETLTGQIIDPKCYFGAMKPGEGKVHKACATLCIAGGIPPMFLAEAGDGSRRYFVLTDRVGRGLRGDALKEVLPLVADRVRVDGQVHDGSVVQLLMIEPGAFVRE